jgi:hypothetical protein
LAQIILTKKPLFKFKDLSKLLKLISSQPSEIIGSFLT